VPPDERDLMLLSVAKQPFSAPGWIHEPKLDGLRVLAFAQPPTTVPARQPAN
jgi:ATP-dependent DNA ligase